MADAGGIFALFLIIGVVILLAPRGNVIWTRRDIKRLEPEFLVLFKMRSINSTTGDYWHCTKTGKTYRLCGEDFRFIETKTLEQMRREWVDKNKVLGGGE